MKNWIKDLILFSVLIFLLFYSVTRDLYPHNIVELPYPQEIKYTKPQIETSIYYTIGNIENHFLNKDDSNIDEYIDSFFEAQNTFDIPALLMVSMGYRESKYKINDIGKRGEIGVMQVCKMGIKKCKEYCGEMETANEQIMCGGCWFKHGIDWCGSLEGGLNAYLSGKCKPKYVKTFRVRNIRYRIWIKLHELTNG